MEYEIESTDSFKSWFEGLRDRVAKRRLLGRFERMQQGNFGDYKSLGDGLYELRFFFGSGFRVYYTLRGEQVVLLLTGGDKSGQSRDIEKAREIQEALE